MLTACRIQWRSGCEVNFSIRGRRKCGCADGDAEEQGDGDDIDWELR